jgi:rod shape determining protein RodA
MSSFSASMQVQERTFLKRIDWNYALVIFALNIVGLINLYSATHGANAVGVSRLFLSQIFWLTGGWFLFFMITFFDYNILLRLAWPLYLLNLAALIAVMFVGKVALLCLWGKLHSALSAGSISVFLVISHPKP